MTRGGFRQGFSTAAGAAAFGALVLLALRLVNRAPVVASGPAALFSTTRQGDSFAFLVSATEAAEGIDAGGDTIGGASCSAVY